MMKYGQRIDGHSSLRLSPPKALPEHMRGPIVELSELRTDPEHQGQGSAHNLMLMTTLEADLARYMLLLSVEPGESRARLVTFYGRHGFVPIQAEPLLMVRPFAQMARRA